MGVFQFSLTLAKVRWRRKRAPRVDAQTSFPALSLPTSSTYVPSVTRNWTSQMLYSLDRIAFPSRHLCVLLPRPGLFLPKLGIHIALLPLSRRPRLNLGSIIYLSNQDGFADQPRSSPSEQTHGDDEKRRQVLRSHNRMPRVRLQSSPSGSLSAIEATCCIY